jgi:hypothetical protein
MTRLSTRNPPHNIRRVDHDSKGDHGWIVTLQRRGAVIVKRFSDGIYGGKREALKAAVEYRDSFIARDKPFDHQIWIRTRLRKNNKSGIPGVHRYEITDNRNPENVRIYWIAAWTDQYGATRQRKFSVARYGEDEAKLLAIAERDYRLRRVCAINAAARKLEYPDQGEIWKTAQVGEGRYGEGQGKNPEGNADHGHGSAKRVRVIEANIDQYGNVTLLEPVELASTRRALVTIFAEGREHSRESHSSAPASSD